MDDKEPSSGSLGTRSKATYLEDTPQQSCLRAGASVSHNFSLSLPCLKKMVSISPLLKTSAFSVQASWMAVWRLGPLACPSPHPTLYPCVQATTGLATISQEDKSSPQIS